MAATRRLLITHDADDGKQVEFNPLQDVMSHLKASCIRGCGGSFNFFSSHTDPYCSYQTAQPPYLVLNRLGNRGCKVITANSVADKSGNYVSENPMYVEAAWPSGLGRWI